MSQSWQCRSAMKGYLPPDWPTRYVEVYLASCLVSMLQLLGGVATVAPTNIAECACFLFAIFIGTMLFAAVQGIIVQVMTTGDPDETAFRTNLDELNEMMDVMHVSYELKKKVRGYYTHAKPMVKRQHYLALIDNTLSPRLRTDMLSVFADTVFATFVATFITTFLTTVFLALHVLLESAHDGVSSSLHSNKSSFCF